MILKRAGLILAIETAVFTSLFMAVLSGMQGETTQRHHEMDAVSADALHRHGVWR